MIFVFWNHPEMMREEQTRAVPLVLANLSRVDSSGMQDSK